MAGGLLLPLPFIRSVWINAGSIPAPNSITNFHISGDVL